MPTNDHTARSGVYQIRNLVNGKVYIGSAVHVGKRWAEHLRMLRAGMHHSRHLQMAWRKYGGENFAFEVVEFVDDKAALIPAEQEWFDKVRPFDQRNGYNVSPTAGSCLGMKHTAEVRAKISRFLRQRGWKPESRAKLSRTKKGKPRPPASIAKMKATKAAQQKERRCRAEQRQREAENVGLSDLGRAKSSPNFNLNNPATWLEPDEPLIGADGRDWSWCYVWHKDVPGFPGYKAGADGSIWSCWLRGGVARIMGASNQATSRWRRVKGHVPKDGYTYVRIKSGDAIVTTRAHKLVASAFLGAASGMVICFRDGNGRNCRLENLKYDTRSGSMRARHGRGTAPVGSRHQDAKLTESSVAEIRSLYASGVRIKELAIRYGVSRTSIFQVVNRLTWKHVA